MILVIDMNWKKDSLAYAEFVLPLVYVAQELDQCRVKHYLEINNEEIIACNKIVLSGTPLKDNVTLTQPEKFSWLKTVDKPILGVCAGMQTLGVVFGLELTRSLQIGMTEVCTVKDNPLFSGTFKAYTLHNFSVAASGEFEVLAQSTKCIQAVRHKKKPIFGVLFHPEVRNPEILKRFCKLQY
jgi:anthranilate/para-aminobenzoate synthase component II